MFWKKQQLNYQLEKEVPLRTPFRDLTFTIFDTEATGFAISSHDRLIELAAVQVSNLEVNSNYFQTYVNPQRSIPDDIIELTGITAERVKHAPDSLEAIEQFFQFTEAGNSHALVGHYVSFDMMVLKKELQRHRYRFRPPLCIDTLDLIGYISPSKDMRDLETYAKQFGTRIYERHQALGDAMTTAHLFCELLTMLESYGKGTLADLVDISSMTQRALQF
ncbi:3'-5' exonuclease [Halalkalibacter urbisdiaboli]|uniref:3'-5' exonuclease n=1 Tax=Halalkalibacter urbisdiaboli TaxID=1960589 RepID=UPI000B453B3D|nr:3'-5' exonuclease [Halalkalibacter urbisdiaboli]